MSKTPGGGHEGPPQSLQYAHLDPEVRLTIAAGEQAAKLELFSAQIAQKNEERTRKQRDDFNDLVSQATRFLESKAYPDARLITYFIHDQRDVVKKRRYWRDKITQENVITRQEVAGWEIVLPEEQAERYNYYYMDRFGNFYHRDLDDDPGFMRTYHVPGSELDVFSRRIEALLVQHADNSTATEQSTVSALGTSVRGLVGRITRRNKA